MNFWNECWDFFLPRHCVICHDRLLTAQVHICLSCLIKLPRTPFLWSEGNEFEQNLWGKLPLVRATSYLHYAKGGDVRKLLYELKYYHNPTIGLFLGKCMAQELLPLGFFKGIDYIIPVPLHPKKERKRGYNQSKMIAQGVSDITQIAILSDQLARKQYNETQTDKGLYERWANVQNIFTLSSPTQLVGKHILLIDDVFTTGATIVACADAFCQVNNLRISVLTLAYVG